MKKIMISAPILVFLAIFIHVSQCSLIAQNRSEPKSVPAEARIHVSLGIPKDADPSDDYIIARKQYVLSYNNKMNVANWVCWNLNSGWYGDVSRYKGKFKKDTLLPDGFYRVSHDDYTNSGYDRGHMVRSEERTRTKEDNIGTFFMTNILPQTPDLNQGVWLSFEYFCEKMCKLWNKELFIIAGGIFLSNNMINYKIAVPDSCFKIAVILNRGEGPEQIKATTLVIAVAIPNVAGVRKDEWEKYITSVDNIESSTGYDFLDRLPDNIESALEKRRYNPPPEPTPLKEKKKKK